MTRWDADKELKEDRVAVTARVLGRKSSGAGAIEELDAADLEAILGPQDPNTDASLFTSGTLPAARLPGTTGDVTSPAGSNALSLAAGDASKLNAGTLAAGRLPALTGDVTKPANSGVTTLAAGSASVLNAGTLPVARTPAYTGEVTKPAGSGAQTVAATHSGSTHAATQAAAEATAAAGLTTGVATHAAAADPHAGYLKESSAPRSVKDYGAVGDGATSADGAAINTAIAAQPSGGAVIIPSGVYNSTVRILHKAGVSVIGFGRPTIRLVTGFSNSGNKCMYDAYDTCDPTSEITGLNLDANQLADITILACRITGTAQAKLRIHHNVISGALVSGVQVGLSTDTGSSSNVVVENNEFVNPTGWAGFGTGSTAMVAYLADSWWYENIHETAGGVYSAGIHAGGIWVGNHFMAQNNGGGVLIDKANNTLIANNWFDHLLDIPAIVVAPGNGMSVTALHVTGNRFAGPALSVDNTTSAIIVAPTGTGTVRALAFKNNMVVGDATHAFKSMVDISGVTGAKSTVTVTNNEILYANQILTGTLTGFALKHFSNRLLTFSAQTGPLGTLAAATQYESENRGSVALGGGPTTLDITHGLAGAPAYVNIRMTAQGSAQPGITLTTVATTNDTIHLTWASNPGAQTIYWEARL